MLHYVDRSRYQTGLSHCLRNRYLSYDFDGIGLSDAFLSVPLATGTHIHSPLEHICKWVQVEQEEGRGEGLRVPDEIIREGISNALEVYTKEVDDLGWDEVEGIIDPHALVQEQSCLVAGLVWCWALEALPWIVVSWNVVAVEQEFEIILGCTCGLGTVGDPKIHNSRGCNGICLMTRPDLIVQHKATGIFAYIEFKSESYITSMNWPDKYYDNIQFALGAVAAEKALGEEIGQLYVHGMHKGTRRKAKDDPDGPKKQNSILCYAYFKEGIPPLTPQDVSPEYYKIDENGKKYGCTRNRGYETTPVWQIPFDTNLHPMEHYVKDILTKEQRSGLVRLLGPIDHPGFLVQKLLGEMVHEERRWIERAGYVRELEVKHGWASEEVQSALDEFIPRSWNCAVFGGMCSKKPICFEEEGWKDPWSMKRAGTDALRYARRTPNHPIENEGLDHD